MADRLNGTPADRSGRKLHLLAEKIELIMVSQGKMLCASVRKCHVHTIINDLIARLTDLLFFRCFDFFQCLRDLFIRDIFIHLCSDPFKLLLELS